MTQIFLKLNISLPCHLNTITNQQIVYYTGWPKLKYPGSKFAIFWQQHKILQPILRQLLSTNQWINPQNYAYVKKTNLQYCKGESSIFKFYRLTWIAANCPEFISKDEWPPCKFTGFEPPILPCLGCYAWSLPEVPATSDKYFWVKSSSSVDDLEWLATGSHWQIHSEFHQAIKSVHQS